MDAIMNKKRLTIPVEGSDVPSGFRDTGQGEGLRRLKIFGNTPKKIINLKSSISVAVRSWWLFNE
jgi:hypothetical protein